MKIPFYKQTTDYTCGPASLQMVFEYLGKAETQENLAKLLHADPAIGTSHGEMIRGAKDYGFYCYVNENSSISEIRYFISRKLPVITNFIEPSNNDRHYAVIIGVEKKQLILHDPWNGKRFKINIEDFEKRWYDNKNHSKRWIMVLSDTDLCFGKQYMPRIGNQKLKNK